MTAVFALHTMHAAVAKVKRVSLVVLPFHKRHSGLDDREALELAGRMAEHPGVQVTVVRFVDGKDGSEEQSEVMLRPSHTKNADQSYTFSTAVLNEETFAILVLMALVTTFITTPTVDVAFDTSAQLGHVHVRAMTAVSALDTLHDDVAAVAEDKRVSLVVLPFHKRHTGRSGGGGEDVENLGPEWRAVNRRILREAPCSVAVLVDRGFGGGEQVSSEQVAHGVCVVFFGGPEDREALELAGRMAEHPGVQVTVVRFVDGKDGSEEQSEELDEAAVAEFRQRMGSLVRFEERVVVGNVIEEVVSIGKSREYGLVVVGKGRLPSPMVSQLAVRPAEHPELGPIGDALASSGHGVTSSVLVVQQHHMSNADEVPVSVVVDGCAQDGEFAKDMAEP
ncbi:unnamed protein product [Miscanthus lutarioriparius]|uniref:Uncharacterized protein n=1 Tax=Miscanthus lutarioriparius TaxID=422564 RepID=A0A811RXZ9_9POAL|nr:unnamed protein product [Miscanthus lutarioriparius]